MWKLILEKVDGGNIKLPNFSECFLYFYWQPAADDKKTTSVPDHLRSFQNEGKLARIPAVDDFQTTHE